MNNDDLKNSPEAILVAGALLDPQLVAEASPYVSPDDFVDGRLKAIWRAVGEMIDQGRSLSTIDMVSVSHHCAKGSATRLKLYKFMAQLTEETPRYSSLVHHAQHVHRRATLRVSYDRLKQIGSQLKNQLETADGDYPSFDEDLSQLSVAVAQRSDQTVQRTRFQDMATEVGQYFERMASGHGAGYIPTGFPGLDRRLGGGLRPGQLHAIEGSTGSGKTSLASQLCDYAVHSGHHALMFSMEVDPLDIYIRDVEKRAGSSRFDLRDADAQFREASRQKLLQAHADLATEQHGKIVYGEPVSVQQIRKIILTETIRSGKVEMIAVDHAQVALPSMDDRRGAPRYLEVKSVAEGLRRLAKHLNVAVVLTAQLNPAPKDEDASMHHIRESKDINNAAEVVLVIDHKFDEAADGTRTITESRLHLQKARAGQCGRINLRYRGDIYRFEEIAEGNH